MEINLIELLANFVLVGGGSAAVAYQVFKFLGSTWLENKFAEKLEAFRHEKAKELEELRAEIDGALRARIRHQEKQFLVISECWNLMNVAYGAAQTFISPFQQYEDLKRMSDKLRSEFVANLDILEAQKEEILDAVDPTKAYIQIVDRKKANAAEKAAKEFNNAIYLNEIFFDEQISDEFKQIAKLMRSSILSKRLAGEDGERQLGTEAWRELEEKCHPKILQIATELRERIGRVKSP